jgi:hypothetical protein
VTKPPGNYVTVDTYQQGTDAIGIMIDLLRSQEPTIARGAMPPHRQTRSINTGRYFRALDAKRAPAMCVSGRFAARKVL